MPLYRRGWEILKNDWLVFLWKLFADFATRISTVLIGLFVLTLFAFDFQQFSGHGRSLFDWFEHLGILLRSPQFIAGLVGTVFFVNLIGVAVQAVVVGGIWGLLDRGLDEQQIDFGKTFFSEALRRFSDVFGLFLLRLALGAVVTFLGVTLLMAAGYAWSTGGLAELPRWQLTVVLAGAIASYLAWSGLTRLVIEVVGAPLVLDDVDLGEAILRGASFVLDNFWSLYRLLLFALGLLLIPLGTYWVMIMFNNLTLLWPAMEAVRPVASVLQFGAEIFLYLAVTVVGILFYGALFSFYHCDDDRFEQGGLPGSSDDPQPTPDDEPTKKESELGDDVQLSEMLPDESPRRFSSRQLLSDESDESPPDDKSDRSTTSDGGDSDPGNRDSDRKNRVRQKENKKLSADTVRPDDDHNRPRTGRKSETNNAADTGPSNSSQSPQPPTKTEDTDDDVGDDGREK